MIIAVVTTLYLGSSEAVPDTPEGVTVGKQYDRECVSGNEDSNLFISLDDIMSPVNSPRTKAQIRQRKGKKSG